MFGRIGGCVAALCGMLLYALLAAGIAGATGYEAELPADLGRVHVTVGEAATLTVWNRPVVTLRARIDEVTPKMRVSRIHDRIAALPASVLSGAVTIVPGQLGSLSGFWVYLEGRTLFALLPEDVDPDSGQSLEQTAISAADALQRALRARADQQRLPLLIRGVIVSFLATVVFVAAIWAIVRLRARALRGRAASAIQRPFAVRGFNLRPYLRTFEEGAIKATAIGAGIVAADLWLTVILLQFPYTRPWGSGLSGWLLDLIAMLGEDILRALPGLFTVVVIFLLTRLLIQASERFFRSVETGWLRVSWLEAETARATRRIATVLIWMFALTVAYPYIPGSQSDAFKGISVLLGLMLSLGSAGFVNQVISGLYIVYSRSVKPGEFIQVGETQGKITEVGLLATKLVTPTRQEITIPNAALAASSVTNYSRLADAETGSIFGTTVTIGYDTPWRQVCAMLLLAAERTEKVRKAPKPRVQQRSLSDFYVEYQLLFSIDQPESVREVLSELHANIQDVFNEFGVQIMSPHFETQPQEKVWVPRPTWFQAPADAPDGAQMDNDTESSPRQPDAAR